MPFVIRNDNYFPIVIPDATEQTDGLMSAADKTKLDGLAPGGGSAPPANSVQTSDGTGGFLGSADFTFVDGVGVVLADDMEIDGTLDVPTIHHGGGVTISTDAAADINLNTAGNVFVGGVLGLTAIGSVDASGTPLLLGTFSPLVQIGAGTGADETVNLAATKVYDTFLVDSGSGTNFTVDVGAGIISQNATVTWEVVCGPSSIIIDTVENNITLVTDHDVTIEANDTVFLNANAGEARIGDSVGDAFTCDGGGTASITASSLISLLSQFDISITSLNGGDISVVSDNFFTVTAQGDVNIHADDIEIKTLASGQIYLHSTGGSGTIKIADVGDNVGVFGATPTGQSAAIVNANAGTIVTQFNTLLAYMRLIGFVHI